MGFDRAKWSNYVHSLISNNQGVNTTPFCAGTLVLLPRHQVGTCSPLELFHVICAGKCVAGPQPLKKNIIQMNPYGWPTLISDHPPFKKHQIDFPSHKIIRTSRKQLPLISDCHHYLACYFYSCHCSSPLVSDHLMHDVVSLFAVLIPHYYRAYKELQIACKKLSSKK